MRSLLLASALAALVACNPYDPDLGDHPFRCGAEAPQCPDGYRCVEHSPNEKICERGDDTAPDGGDDPPDAAAFLCNDDGEIEPNETPDTAANTPIPASAMFTSFGQLAICPATDKDVFRFGVNASNVNVRASVTAELGDGDLALQILNGSGAVIANGTALTSTEVQVVVNNLAIGNYFVQVTGKDGSENNYEVEIVTCVGSGGSSCPDPT